MTTTPTGNEPKLQTILPDDWNEEILDALGAFPHGLNFVMSRWEAGGDDARGVNMLGALAQYPELAKAFLTFNCHVASNSSLNARDRELLILRVGWLRKSEYEFAQHIILGRRAGLTDKEIERTQYGPDADGWSDEDRDLIRAADELNLGAGITESSFEKLSARYDHTQIMDMIFLVGCYINVALCISSFNIPLEPDTISLDEETRRRMYGIESE